MSSDSHHDTFSAPCTPMSQRLASTNNYIGVRVIEALLQKNVAKIGHMHVFVQVNYGEQVWKSPLSMRAGMKPRWNSYHNFEINDSDVFHITLYHKAMIFGDIEIGSCNLQLADIRAGHLTEWWTVFNTQGEIAGTILITFDTPQEEHSLLTTHSSQNSLDIREEFLKNIADMDFEKDAGFPIHNFQRDKLNFRLFLTQENAEIIKRELTEENTRLREKESNLKLLFEQAEIESAKIKRAKAELKRCKHSLKRREYSLQLEESELQFEKEKLKKDKEEIQRLRAQLKHDTAKLKQENAKLSSEKRKIDESFESLGDQTKKIYRENLQIRKESQAIPMKPVEKENSDELREISQVQETLATKKRIIEEHLTKVMEEFKLLQADREQLELEKEELNKFYDSLQSPEVHLILSPDPKSTRLPFSSKKETKS